jgi:ABC-type dipeptide/oligopeptide/nickel transport system permease component
VRSGVIPFLTRRMLLVPVMVFAVIALTYAFTHHAPGDAVRIIAGSRNIEPERAELIREAYGLQGNYFERFGNYVWGIVSRGDLGPSYFYRSPQRSVQELLAERIGVSMQINVIVLVLTFGLGIPLGIYAALRAGTWKDPALIGFFKIFDAIPAPIMVVVLVFFFVETLGPFFRLFGFNVPVVWTPGDPASFIVPVLSLTLPVWGGMARFVRASMLTTIQEDYVRTARAKGLSERRIIIGHEFRNAMLPLATSIGFAIIGIVGGSIIVETRYGVPGVGQFIFESINQRDFNVVLGFTILTAALLIVANALIDVAYVFIDPRISYEGRQV